MDLSQVCPGTRRDPGVKSKSSVMGALEGGELDRREGQHRLKKPWESWSLGRVVLRPHPCSLPGASSCLQGVLAGHRLSPTYSLPSLVHALHLNRKRSFL